MGSISLLPLCSLLLSLRKGIRGEGTRRHRRGTPGSHLETSPHPRWGDQARRGLQAAKGSKAWSARPRPVLREASPSAQHSDDVGDRGGCVPAPWAARPRRLEASESARNKGGTAFQRPTTNRAAIFPFFPPKRAAGQIWGPGGARAGQARGACADRGAGGRGRPRSLARAGRRGNGLAGGGAGRRGPRRLLFLPLPVPRGHVAMATVLLTAAASRRGWRVTPAARAPVSSSPSPQPPGAPSRPPRPAQPGPAAGREGADGWGTLIKKTS